MLTFPLGVISPQTQSSGTEWRWPCCLLWTQVQPSTLSKSIDARAQAMLRDGLLAEVGARASGILALSPDSFAAECAILLSRSNGSAAVTFS